ncbi:MAG: prolyl oligopeptidase family serine peptidase [Terriglobales bacterium]
MPWIFLFFAVTFILFGMAIASQTDQPAKAAPAGPPKAKVEVVTDDLHGQKIDDPYRWLENSDSPESQEYVREQLAYTRSILDPLPGRAKIHNRLTELLQIGNIGTPQVGGKRVFYTRREGAQNQPVLYVRDSVNGSDRELVNVNALAADGTVALDWWQPTHDGKLLAYGTSPSGSELSTLHVVDVATGKLLPDSIERTRAASVAWKLDNSGFWYTRYPKKGDVPEGQEAYNRHVFYHALGDDPAKDPDLFGKGRDPQDWPNVQLSEDGRWLLVGVSEGWTKSELYLKDLQKDSDFVRITDGKNFLYGAVFYKGTIFIHTNEDTPRYKVMTTSVDAPERKNWKELIPQTEAVLQGIDIAGGQLLAQYEHNAASELSVYSTAGKKIADVGLPALGTIAGTGNQWDSNDVFYGFQSFTIPPTIYHFDVSTLAASGKATEVHSTKWAQVKAPVQTDGYQVQQLWYHSKDGTRVPMFVVHKKGLKRDGHNPTLLSGYGGFNVSETPAFSRGTFLWLEHGGVYALANLRGGAEFGEDWHRAGMLDKKQNVFDDFIAAAEFLVAQKYTDKDHLAISGGSNGGLLVGAAMTQRPDLFKAVLCQVPLLDMLRYQNFQIAKLWIPEYGSADDPKQFEWLVKYSPYHNIKEGIQYPAVMFVTADSDTRVDPMHAKKMAARLQAAATNGSSRERPILLRIEPKAGHGAGKPLSKQIEEGTDLWSFIFWQLGVTP